MRATSAAPARAGERAERQRHLGGARHLVHLVPAAAEQVAQLGAAVETERGEGRAEPPVQWRLGSPLRREVLDQAGWPVLGDEMAGGGAEQQGGHPRRGYLGRQGQEVFILGQAREEGRGQAP